ncbi:hypothetical protein SVA_2554 [Sulfurifustis variabilis]|uniref:DUF1858 domain-containing protein n=1 Tax=Sulfurifustis variabilis TaxID=1675686 RepID=A0A1B4V8Y6_9GAMM|nr:hypothetical protein [Sulfurifustis variabilis]BAU49102.1 hypothetical protein SVA_2554 [Sulfurifustis variabilis]
MAQTPITPDMTMWSAYRYEPKVYEVFQRYGCPDIRRGIFPLLSRVMRIRWAARIHNTPLDALMRDLNAVASGAPRAAEPARARPGTL